MIRFDRFRVYLIGATLFFTLASLSNAQDYSEYNTVRNPDKYVIDWAAFYKKANALSGEAKAGLANQLDIAFGADQKQRLDLYLPETSPAKAPVLIFFHGGGFMEGDRAHYAYIARPFVRRGVITAVASYRLTTSGFQYPAQADDAKAAVIWIYNNVSAFGGDPQRMFLSGHSAGAILIADLGVDRSWLQDEGISPSVIKGIAPVSGDYEISPGERPAYTPTRELELMASPVGHIVDPPDFAIVSVGSKETARVVDARDFVEALTLKGVDAELVILSGQDHADAVLSLGSDGTKIFDAVMNMIENAQ